METASWFSLASLVYLVVGAAAGVAAGLYLSPAIKEAKRLRGDLDRLQGEHEAYRGSVDAHFRKTADLVGEMTKSYAAVYDHLAGGARSFCDASSDRSVSFDPLPGALAAPVLDTAIEEAVVEEAAVEEAAVEEAAEASLAEVGDETPYADATGDRAADGNGYDTSDGGDGYDRSLSSGAYTMDEVDEELEIAETTGAELPSDPDEAGAPEQRPLHS
jgi:uncharacterized membrane-anchored protein YhcB (DUF1043 family)